ncbi:hypothetical protein FB45DRAFT_1067616 [Roridomyces roridus]|uniref:MYND-type domain-containing protein n=1 Tax=Roridomyces roridus TaxID=1738132 RepID=A0AAD7F887_9AGAR|nr:hypothetical protein FB45DRAFT_1067616 [Roridomyces roridus]
MHECLRLGALENLPISVRSFAQAAVSGSTDRMQWIVEAMMPEENTPSLIYLLPLVYRLLHPARIPTSDPDYAVLTRAEADACEAAMAALQAVAYTKTIPHEVTVDVWNRIWRWHQFLEAHYKVSEDFRQEQGLCCRTVQVAHHLQRHPHMGPIIKSTPRFYSAVFQTWMVALEVAIYSKNFSAIPLFNPVAPFMAEVDFIATPQRLEDFVDDHDISFVATRLLEHAGVGLKLFKDPPQRRAGSHVLSIALGFLILVAKAAYEQYVPLARQLFVELARQDIALGLVRVAHTVLQTSNVPNPATILNSLYSLRFIFREEMVNPKVRLDIATGIIYIVAVCGQDVDLAELRAETEDVLKDFLLHYLPSLTIHWGDGSGSTVVSALDAHEFRLPALSPALRDAWKNFAALARDRAEFSKSFDSTGIVRMKACDNTLCTAFDARTLFKRCSGCATAFYCSVRCQAIDWNDGHRAACKHHDSLLRGHFGRTSTSPTTSRQRAVMRSILHRDYLDLKLHIYTEAVRSMHLSGDPDAGYFVMFDYTRGGVIVDVHSLALKSRDLIWLWELEPEWDEIEARAERSGGRMTIHVMRVREGSLNRRWVVPLRSSNGMVHDELVNLAWDEAYCNWEDGLQSRLEALVVRSDSEVIEFH